MLFLIDFENTKNSGLAGCEYLGRDDTLLLFYSQNAASAESRRLNQILASGCEFQAVKLKQTGKNGLDFYIATDLGNRFGGGYKGHAAIISNDSGFTAVKDYWSKVSGTTRCVHLEPTVEKAIAHANFHDDRTLELLAAQEKISIEHVYNTYKHDRKVLASLEETFSDTGYGNRIQEIRGIVENARTPKETYLMSMKAFGREDGVNVYRLLKERKKEQIEKGKTNEGSQKQ